MACPRWVALVILASLLSCSGMASRPKPERAGGALGRLPGPVQERVAAFLRAGQPDAAAAEMAGYAESLRWDNTSQRELALELYAEIAERFPQAPVAPEAMRSVGDILEYAARYDEAFAQYRRVWAAYPGSPSARAAMDRVASLTACMGRHREAAQAFAQLLDRYPADPRASAWRVGSAEALLRAGEREAARSALKAIVAGPHGPARGKAVKLLEELGDQ